VQDPRAGPHPSSRSGFMTHEEVTKGLKRFAKDVLPRLQAL
jgi:hypothetical protein